jgi:hypothetical protein
MRAIAAANEIRRAFHGQLKQLWATNKFVSEKMLDVNTKVISKKPIHDEKGY